MRKIAHVISTPEGIGGAEKVMLALVRAGAERGWEQIVLNPFDLTPVGSRLHVEVSNVEGAEYEAISTTRFAGLPGARVWLRSQLHRIGPDIVHVHLFHALVLAATLGPMRPLMLLSHHHGDQLRVAGNRIRELLDRQAGRRFDHVVACSRWVRDFLIETYGYDTDRVTEIPNGWEGEPLDQDGPSDVACTFICVANLRPEKDHLTLLEAFDHVRRQHPSVRLMLVGEGQMRREIENRVGSLRLGKNVVLCGALNDVWPSLSRADVFVLPSRNETLGMAVLEAMVAALPVVATEVGGVPELIEHGENGLLVSPRDPVSLADAMLSLARSPETRTRMGASGRERARHRTMDVMVDRYFDLYERLLAS